MEGRVERDPGGARTALLALVRRGVNGAAAAILRSPAHRLLSGWLLLLTYRGRRTGRPYTIPLMYVRDRGDLLLVALHPHDQSWWRNFRDEAAVEVLLRSRRRHGRASLVGDRRGAHELYVARRPWTRPFLERADEPVFVRVSPQTPEDARRGAGSRLSGDLTG